MDKSARFEKADRNLFIVEFLRILGVIEFICASVGFFIYGPLLIRVGIPHIGVLSLIVGIVIGLLASAKTFAVARVVSDIHAIRIYYMGDWEDNANEELPDEPRRRVRIFPRRGNDEIDEDDEEE